jgi:hypothetical protein
MSYESEDDYKNVDTSIIVPESEQRKYFESQGDVSDSNKPIMNAIPTKKQFRSVTLHTGVYAGSN